jgi:uncharacterized protein YbcV (DUF1398 family)
MDSMVKGVMNECAQASDEERISFPEVVARLLDAGVERYQADLIRSTKTFYLPSGESEVIACHEVGVAPATQFSTAAIEAAVRASQRQEILYREFCRRVASAGCVGYFVSLPGRRAVYYGRTGETHVEHFPRAS